MHGCTVGSNARASLAIEASRSIRASLAPLFSEQDYKSNRRTCLRCVDALGLRANVTTERSEFDQLTITRKKLQAMIIIVDFCRKHSYDHSGLGAVMDAQDHFLKMEPATTLSWPQMLVETKISHQVRSTEDHGEFWRLMVSSFLGQSESDIHKRHASLISQRIIGITKADGMQEQLERLFPTSMDIQKIVSPALWDEIQDVQFIVFRETMISTTYEHGLPRLKLAIANTAKDSLVISSALVVFPAGRNMVASARLFATQAEAMMLSVNVAKRFLEDHSEQLNDTLCKHWSRTGHLVELDAVLKVSLRD
jgi:hypothetical protein